MSSSSAARSAPSGTRKSGQPPKRRCQILRDPLDSGCAWGSGSEAGVGAGDAVAEGVEDSAGEVELAAAVGSWGVGDISSSRT